MILLTGASGLLGSYLLRLLVRASLPVTAWSGSRPGTLFGASFQPVDLTDASVVATAFEAVRPEFVLHCAARASVADCYRDPQRARATNTEGSRLLAGLCASRGARMVHVSTDLVFDGAQAPYKEDSPTSPLSVYAKTKVEAEQAVLAYPSMAVVRVSLLFGPSLTGKVGFFDEQVLALRGGRTVTLFADEWRTPLDLESAARGLLAIARSDISGIVHLGGAERLSRLEMGQRLAAFLGVDAGGIGPGWRAQAPAAEPRARDVSLDSTLFEKRFPELPRWSFEEALKQLMPT